MVYYVDGILKNMGNNIRNREKGNLDLAYGVMLDCVNNSCFKKRKLYKETLDFIYSHIKKKRK